MAQLPDIPHRKLAPPQLTQLREGLRVWAAQTGGTVVTEAEVPIPATSPLACWHAYTAIATAEAQVLVLVQPEEPSQPGDYRVGMTGDRAAIAAFVHTLQEAEALPAAAHEPLATLAQTLEKATVSDPTALIWHLLSLGITGDRDRLLTAENAACQPVQVALDQQQEQSLLLNQVVTKIRQSLDLSVILDTTVAEVRQFLKADRLLIYKFAAEPNPANAGADSTVPPSPHPGYIAYEARASDTLASVLNFTENNCFNADHHCRARYLAGSPVAIDDVQVAYQGSPCLLDLLQRSQVRAKIIAPILIDGHLWGLLIAHQCHQPRQWQPRERQFLQHIAEHLAVAIRQAALYHQLQVQAQSLESCIVDRTQELRDALAAAQAADLAKSEFLATMSHELRTPLTCIIGMSATLLRWSFGDLSPRQREYLTTIRHSGERLLALINDILEMAKIESGRAILEISPVSLNSLAHQSLEAFRQEARDRAIDLSFESVLSPEQDTFNGDPRRIQQILHNLLSNALKFTAAEGKVNLRLRRENQTAVFQVEDTGIGIPPSQFPLLFEKFQQLETSRQRQYQGTGLGLALTKQLVELHSGSISVSSRPGVGSVFTVRLPAQRLSHESPPAPRLGEAPPVPPILGRVVLVEDREETAGIICDLLTAADYQVIWVIEGSRVVEQVVLLQPTVVIISLSIAGINGQRIINALRESISTSQTKILALLSDDGTDPPVEGVDAVLSTPLDPEDLLAQINALIATPVV